MSELSSNRKIPKPNICSNVELAIDDELNFHLDEATDEAVDKLGMAEFEARQLASQKFGDFRSIRSICLKLAWRERMMEKVFSTATVIVLLFLLCGAAAVLFFMAQSRQQMALEARHVASQAEQTARIARNEAELAYEKSEAANQFLIDILKDTDVENAEPTQVVRAMLAQAADSLHESMKDEPAKREKIRQILKQAEADIQDVENSND